MAEYARREGFEADQGRKSQRGALQHRLYRPRQRLEPYAYLRRLFAQLPKAKTVEDFEAMLPFNTT